MVMGGTVCLRRLANSEADECRFGRWLGHDRVTVEEIRADVQARAAEHGWDGHVLAVQDTTELNFQHHASKKPPSPITMHHGLQWFHSLYQGFRIARKMQTVGLLN
jgi:hypothetical protein